MVNPINEYLRLVEKYEIDEDYDLIADKANFIGTISQLILQRKIFKRNSDISYFIEEVFKTEFLDYVMKSRTLLISRLIRIVNSANKKEFSEIIARFNNYIINAKNDEDKEKETIDFLDYWGKVINKDEY
ncbi:hypothetical protein C0971_16880 [Bacillus methanolicus]|uniref:hypothetical protein n=1 Tax=Bacillus methanolicus TaxID=1471 RepID=UPI00201088E9|nr:hypothetical protein [Bacillus methanolicus]UQD53506.1 hypothetical protein C0971_16880 [Bacillus methanolicus]